METSSHTDRQSWEKNLKVCVSLIFSSRYGNGSIMIGFSNGYFVVISTRKDEHGQVCMVESDVLVCVRLLCAGRSCSLPGTTRTASVMWPYPQLSARLLRVGITGTPDPAIYHLLPLPLSLSLSPSIFSLYLTASLSFTSHSIKIHDLSDLKGVYSIIDIEEEKGSKPESHI